MARLDLAAQESIHRRPSKDGDEQDAFTGWRHVLCYLDRAGKAKAVKQRHNRRTRRQVREQLKGERP